jgi:diacylglycerol kinase family enzyme
MVEVVVNDDEKISGNAIEIVIANGQFFGGGMNISPKSSVNDGLAEVQVFMGRRRNAFSVMPKIVKGTHIHHEKVQCLAGKKVRLNVPDDWPIEADGEVLGKGDISVSLVPRAIKFKI